MILFTSNFLICEDGHVVSMMFIESIKLNVTEDQTIDKLKDDITFVIVTTSGKERIVSVKSQFNDYQKSRKDINLIEFHQSIIDKWQFILMGK